MKKNILKIFEKSEGYRYQGPRYKKLGPYSGEEFREVHLLPWLNNISEQEEAVVDFADTIVYSPSFLEESFGGVIRADAKNKEKLTHISFINIDNIWKEKLDGYIKNARPSK